MSVASGTKRKEGGVGEFIRLLIHAGLIALVIRTFLFQPFNIPSGSMKATLLVGDYLFVSKFSYGYSYYSLPLSPPLFSGRIMGSKPDRGDIVVFRLPKDDSTDYIKRVIGLPGDRVQMIQGVLHINGTPVKRDQISVQGVDFAYPDRPTVNKTEYVSQLPGDEPFGDFTDNIHNHNQPFNR
jgi:signal peptidase I